MNSVESLVNDLREDIYQLDRKINAVIDYLHKVQPLPAKDCGDVFKKHFKEQNK